MVDEQDQIDIHSESLVLQRPKTWELIQYEVGPERKGSDGKSALVTWYRYM